MEKQNAAGIHYGWIICITGAVVLFSCLGLGRFSLGMLLPSMGESLRLNYSQMGLISTGNFVGYMLSVLLAGTITELLGARRTIAAGLFAVSLSIVLISYCDGFSAVLVLYAMTGFGSALANVPLMGLVSHWFQKDTRGRAAGFMVSGNGVGIIFSGLFIPWVNLNSGGEGWRTGWLAIGVISLAVTIIAAAFLRNHPRDKGLEPVGKPVPAYDASGRKPKPKGGVIQRDILHLGAIYFLFGATYVVYATFIVTAMVDEHHFAEDTAGKFWAVVGALSIISGPLFGWLSDKFSRRLGMMIVFLLFTVSYSFAALGLSDVFLYASIIVFGLIVWSIPTIMSAAVGDYMGPDQAVKAFGFITLFFGAGQIVGPALAGYLADITGNFSIAFWLCALLTATAVGLAAALKQPKGEQLGN